jgi:hypothetical protein
MLFDGAGMGRVCGKAGPVYCVNSKCSAGAVWALTEPPKQRPAAQWHVPRHDLFRLHQTFPPQAVKLHYCFDSRLTAHYCFDSRLTALMRCDSQPVSCSNRVYSGSQFANVTFHEVNHALVQTVEVYPNKC